jgi:hypothetical protein
MSILDFKIGDVAWCIKMFYEDFRYNYEYATPAECKVLSIRPELHDSMWTEYVVAPFKKDGITVDDSAGCGAVYDDLYLSELEAIDAYIDRLRIRINQDVASCMYVWVRREELAKEKEGAVK